MISLNYTSVALIINPAHKGCLRESIWFYDALWLHYLPDRCLICSVFTWGNKAQVPLKRDSQVAAEERHVQLVPKERGKKRARERKKEKQGLRAPALNTTCGIKQKRSRSEKKRKKLINKKIYNHNNNKKTN